MLATFKNVIFPGHNNLLTTGTDDPTMSINIVGHDLQIGHF